MSGPIRRHSRPVPIALLGLVAVLIAAVMAGCGLSPAAPAYPTKAIDIICSASPGGTNDQTSRILAAYLQKKWGQPVNVINKPGGGGTPATVSVVQSPADGYAVTLLSDPTAFQNYALEDGLPIQWDSVSHLGRLIVVGMGIVVKGDSKYNSLKELAEDIKKDPTKIKYGTGAVAGSGTFAASKLATVVGVDPNKLDRVPFSGGAPTAVAVAGGHVDFAAMLLPEVLELTRGGKLKMLAVTTPERVKDMPNVPTTKELGFAAVDQMAQYGVGGPPKLPAGIVKKWEDTMAEATKDPQFVAEIEKSGSIPAYMNAADYRTWVESKFKNTRELAEQLGLRGK